MWVVVVTLAEVDVVLTVVVLLRLSVGEEELWLVWVEIVDLDGEDGEVLVWPLKVEECVELLMELLALLTDIERDEDNGTELLDDETKVLLGAGEDEVDPVNDNVLLGAAEDMTDLVDDNVLERVNIGPPVQLQ